MAFVSRGFRGRRAAGVDPARVPPGQYVTRDFPVLSAGPTPHTSLELWDFSIVGELDEPRGWSWEEFRALPSEEITRDIHCVTKWSKLDTVWKGVSVDTLLEGIETSAQYVTAYSDGGYTTNLPLEDVTGGKAWVVFDYGGDRSRPSTAAPRGCSSRTSTSGRAPNGCAGLRLTVDRRARLLGDQRLPQPRRPMARAALPGRLTWQFAEVVERRRGDASLQDASSSKRPTGPATAPASTSTFGSPPRTAIRRSAATRSRRPRGRALRSRSSGSTTARSRRTWSTSSGRATSSSCADRSAATSSGSDPPAGRCC